MANTTDAPAPIADSLIPDPQISRINADANKDAPAPIADSLIPVRALNQVSYCPRLYYLQYVECLMPVNEFVEDGLFQHRRVNDPELENRTLTSKRSGKKSKDEDPPALETTRSVTLSSERLGLVGKLDIVETKQAEVRSAKSESQSAKSEVRSAKSNKNGSRQDSKESAGLFDQQSPIGPKKRRAREKENAGATLFDFLDGDQNAESPVTDPTDSNPSQAAPAPSTSDFGLRTSDAPPPLTSDFGLRTSDTESLQAALDRTIRDSSETYPVEYKRSAGPAQGYWENDAIQVCAQAMLLEEELGQPVPRGFLYYQGSKTRVPVQLDQTLRAKTFAAIQLIRELQAHDTPPEPLPDELRHRCHGCSLAPVCMPEETLYLIRHAEQSLKASTPPGPASPQSATRNPKTPFTRVLAQADDGAVAYLQEQGSRVSQRGEHLIVKIDGAELNRLPLAAIRQVVIFGNVQLSTQALQVLASNDIPVAFLTTHGRFIAALQAAPTKNVQLRLDQYRAFSDPVRALGLAKAVVKAKIANQRTLMMRTLRARDNPSRPREPSGADGGRQGDKETRRQGETGNPDEPEAVGPDSQAGRGNFGPRPDVAVGEMADLLAKVDAICDPAVLLGTEGQAAHIYFSRFGSMLKSSPGREFDFQKRQRRPPPDPVNAMLSFAYAILAKDVFSALATVGFDPYHGFFHAGRHGRPSLALDLMEEFRPIIADSVVLTLINNGLVVAKDFVTWREACQLTEEGRKTFFRTYELRKAVEVTHPVFGYKMSYSRMLEVQARLLAAYVRGDIPQYTGFTVR